MGVALDLGPFRVEAEPGPWSTAAWATWDPEVREELHRVASDLRKCGEPIEVDVRDGELADRTLVLDRPCANVRRFGGLLADRFGAVSLRNGVVLLRDLHDERLDADVVRNALVAARSEIVARYGDEFAASVIPSMLHSTTRALPLHADLVPADHLCTVFSEVSGGGGRAVFLRMSAMLTIAQRHREVPRPVADRLRVIANSRVRRDFHEEFVELLHGGEWSASLAQAVEPFLQEVALGEGEGYLLHDRRWLHGRTRTRERVPRRRALTLAFSTTRRSRRPSAAARPA